AVINPISFFTLFEFRLFLFKLLEDNGACVTRYNIVNEAIDKKISGKGNDQDYFSINAKEILEELDLSDIMEINTITFPKIIKEGEELRQYSAYFIGDKIILEGIDASLKEKGRKLLERTEKILSSFLGTKNYFFRLDFIFKAGIPMIYDIIPSPDIREERILKHLINLIIRGK
ncbi:MAG: hypothetical protein PHV06_08720, partial [bacterium]|nr:hypothetical protein [bacterium]